MRPSLRQAMISTFAGASALVMASTASANTTTDEFHLKAADQPEISAADQDAEVILVADLGDRLRRQLEQSAERTLRDALGGGNRGATSRTATERGADGLRYREVNRNITDPGIYYYVTDTRQGTSHPNNRGTQSPRDDYRHIYNGYGEWVGTCDRENATREKCHGPIFGAPVR